MAVMYPDRFPADGPDSERQVYNRLATLPDDWHVLHDIAWQSSEAGITGDGQTDFVLVHPRQGMVALEVKGGGIEIERGQYVTVNEDGRFVIKNPFGQARTAKHVLLDYLKSTIPDLPYLALAHGVVFPDVTDPPLLGPEAPRDIVIDRSDLRSVNVAVDRLVAHWGQTCTLEPRHIEAITTRLAPTASVRRLLLDDVADAQARLHRLTESQFRTLRQIKKNRHALIYGGAGTGKTLLAVERSRELASDGFRVLLTCFNSGLGAFLAAQLTNEGAVTVATFHSLCSRLAREAQLPWPRDADADWFDFKAPDLLVDAASVVGFEVDAVVVDEGQDFSPHWWQALRMLMAEPDEGPFYVFADHHQAIYRRSDIWEPPFEGFVLELFTNCRNTLPIAERVAQVYGDDVDSLGAPGPSPEFIEIQSYGDALRAVRQILVRLLMDDGLAPRQIAVLTGSAQLAEDLRELVVANQPLVELGGDGVVADTFHSFKGLEADVVVAVLPDFRAADHVERHRALAYIGMSRACAHLIVVGTAASRGAVGWPGRTEAVG